MTIHRLPTHDVIVIGAGPGGASAALAASSAGLNCLLLEARSYPGERTACGGGVTADLAWDLALPPGVAEQQLDSMAFRYMEGASPLGPDLQEDREAAEVGPPASRVRIWRSWRTIGVTVDRRRFDRHLADRAVEQGAILRNECRFVDLDPATRRLTYRNPAGALVEARAPFIVFADGARTAAPRYGPFGFQATRTNTIAAIAWEYRLPQHTFGRFDCFYHAPSNPWGYYWIFPRGDVVNVGVGVITERLHRQGADRQTLSGLLKRFLEGFDIFRGVQPERKLGGLVPLEPARRVAHEGMLVVGDAAGLVNPITGGGIHHACFSGRLAGEAVARAWRRGSRSTPYQRWLRSSPNYLWLSLLSRATSFAYRAKPGEGYLFLSDALGAFAEHADRLGRSLGKVGGRHRVPGWH